MCKGGFRKMYFYGSQASRQPSLWCGRAASRRDLEKDLRKVVYKMLLAPRVLLYCQALLDRRPLLGLRALLDQQRCRPGGRCWLSKRCWPAGAAGSRADRLTGAAVSVGTDEIRTSSERQVSLPSPPAPLGPVSIGCG